MPETRIVSCTCKKCGETFKLNINNATREEIESGFMKQDGFQCPGHHVELGPREDCWTIDWDSLRKDHVPSEEEWLEKLKNQNQGVWDTKSVQEFFKIQGFFGGACIAINKETGQEVCLDYVHSPDGVRYYYLT